MRGLVMKVGHSSLLARLGLNRRAHRTLATGNSLVGAVGVDLIALQLGVLHRRGQADGLALFIDLFGDQKALFALMTKQLLHHLDDVFVGMIVVVPENDVVPRLLAGRFLLGLLFR